MNELTMENKVHITKLKQRNYNSIININLKLLKILDVREINFTNTLILLLFTKHIIVNLIQTLINSLTHIYGNK